MLAIEINFLTGRYVATAHNDRQQSEWPPHPARLFSAMVATWHESADFDPQEKAAMEWLEAQPPPSVAASPAVARTVASHFVPVNDTAIISRSWQEKQWASVSELNAQIEEELERSGGEITKKLEGCARGRFSGVFHLRSHVKFLGQIVPITLNLFGDFAA